MPLRVHPDAAWWDFRGSPNVDSLRLRVKDPTADYWVFDDGKPDYLTQSDGKEDDFHPAGDFTVMARIRLDVTPNDHILINKFTTGSGGREWEMHFDSSGNFVASVAVVSSAWVSATVPFTFSGPHDLLVALTYDASTGTVYGYVLDTGTGWSNSAVTGTPGEIHDSGAPVRIAVQEGLSGTEWPDRIYWWGYTNQKLSQAQLQALFDNQDMHPMDHDCKAYDDFSDTVGATHTTLIGGYVFTVTGSPTHVGDGGPTWPDPSRLFEPARWENDFTILGSFEPDNVGAGVTYPIFSKWNDNGVNQRCWRIRQSEDDLIFSISKDGTAAGMTEVTVPAVLAAGQRSFFSMRYQEGGDGSSDLICEVDGTVVSSSTAVSPIFKSNKADVQIATQDASSSEYLDGKIYWLAMWNEFMTTVENDNVRTYYVRPIQTDPRPFYYDDFHDDVAAEKESTIPGDNTYNAYFWKEGIVFDVDGSPVHGGSSENSADVYISTPASVRGRLYRVGDVLDSWHTFDGSDDFYRISGTDAQAADFDPVQHGNDFSIVAWFWPQDLSAALTEAIFAKYHTAGPAPSGTHRSYALYQSGPSNDDKIAAVVSADGANIKYHHHTMPSAQEIYFAAMTYKYFGAANSRLRSWLIGPGVDDFQESNDAPGPIRSTTAANVNIGTHEGSTTDHEWQGKIFCVAYFQREILPQEVRAMENLEIPPWLLHKCIMTWLGIKPVDTTYVTEFGGYTFTRSGNPVAGGTGKPVIYAPDALYSVFHNNLYSTIGLRTRDYPKISEKSIPKICDTPEIFMDHKSSLRVAVREYPRVSKKDLGPKAHFWRIKPRAGSS